MLRAGCLTASEFDRLLTPATLKDSAQAEDYLARLAGEWFTGHPSTLDPTGWMTHGIAYEPEALAWWEFTTGRAADRPAFVYLDERRLIGCSPDAMGVEIKCPAMHTHVRWLLAGSLPREHLLQVQGCMYVTGLDSWDFVSYHAPANGEKQLPPLHLTVERDPVVHARLAAVLESACTRLLAMRARLGELCA
jgi:hypothetical protein